MRSLTFVLGGARSGKSAFAQQLALEQAGHDVLYIATYRVTENAPADVEMQTRINRHRASRPVAWQTLELGDDLVAIHAVFQKRPSRVVLLDCLSLYISGELFMQSETPHMPEDAAVDAMNRLFDTIQAIDSSWIVVSNEVGAGVVPDNAIARAYRDAIGRSNQMVASHADTVYFLVAGLPMKLK
jgi:adenosyl cobinamide kinase/adenosyl cobinamide phosphate guanylyltransferase